MGDLAGNLDNEHLPLWRMTFVWTALSDRRGESTAVLFHTDPWYHKWMVQTRQIMKHYRVRT